MAACVREQKRRDPTGTAAMWLLVRECSSQGMGRRRRWLCSEAVAACSMASAPPTVHERQPFCLLATGCGGPSKRTITSADSPLFLPPPRSPK